MKALSRRLSLALLGGALALSVPAFAEADGPRPTRRPRAAPLRPRRAPYRRTRESTRAHADDHGGHGHAPTFDDINWAYGFLGEKEGVEPDLLWRPKGMPVPFGALALNAAILYWLLIKFGKKPIGDALKARKLGIMKGMEDAAKMKASAEASLAKYQKKSRRYRGRLARSKREMQGRRRLKSARILSEDQRARTGSNATRASWSSKS